MTGPTVAASDAITEADHCEVTACLCGCGAVRITLFDKAHKPFAHASFRAANAMNFAAMIAETAREALCAGACETGSKEFH